MAELARLLLAVCSSRQCISFVFATAALLLTVLLRSIRRAPAKAPPAPPAKPPPELVPTPPADGQLVKPKPGQAPAMLARAIEASKRNPDAAATPFTPSPAPFTPTSNFAESRPERGSFADMAAGY